jgi:hypothetical protein
MSVLNLLRSRFFVLAVLLTVFGHALGGENGENRSAEIKSMVKRIQSEKGPMARTNLATDLSDFVRKSKEQGEVDDGAIDSIAELLDDDDDSIRLWAALSLGQIGHRAIRSIPMLEKAEKKAEIYQKSFIVGPDLSSLDAVKATIEKIKNAKE